MWAENTTGKGENAGYQQFLLFPQFFTVFTLWVVTTLDCVVQVASFHKYSCILVTLGKKPFENIEGKCWYPAFPPPPPPHIFYYIKIKILSPHLSKNCAICKPFEFGTVPLLHTHFNPLKKTALGKYCEKGQVAPNEQFNPFPQCFLCNL